MSLDLIGGSSESFFAVFLVGLAILDFFAFLFEFVKARAEFISLIGKLSHLTQEDHVGQVESAILVVVGEVGFGVCIIHGSC